jgi:hypothetical protein
MIFYIALAGGSACTGGPCTQRAHLLLLEPGHGLLIRVFTCLLRAVFPQVVLTLSGR